MLTSFVFLFATAQAEPLTVATIERRPFVMETDQGVSGFSIDLWNAVGSELGEETTFVTCDTFGEMLGKVERGEVDAAVANITVTSAREVAMDFSRPMFDAGIRIAVPAGGQSTSVLRALFTWDMAALLGLATVVLFAIANFVWLLERRQQEYFAHPYPEGVFRGFWWALNVIVNGGFEEKLPTTWIGRVFSVFLVVASLFVVSAFVAKITATLTIAELESSVRDVQDLYGKRVGTTSGSTAANLLETRGVRFRGFDSVDEMFDALLEERVDAVVHDEPILDYFAVTEGRGRIQVVGEVLQPEKYAIAFPAGSTLVEPVNRALLKLRENGTADELHDTWFE